MHPYPHEPNVLMELLAFVRMWGGGGFQVKIPIQRPDLLRFPWFSSVRPRKYWGIISNLAMTAFLHFLPN